MNRKISDEEIFEIRRRSKGERQADLAKEFRVAQATISRIVSGISFPNKKTPSIDYLNGFNDGYEAAMRKK